MKRPVVIGTLVIAIAMGAYWYLGGNPSPAEEAGKRGVEVPQISAKAETGALLFAENCVVCHGAHGSGTDGGPPLIHKIYEPSHHGDASFLMAVRNGVRPHHWRFGPMPKIDGLSDSDVSEIVTYVREIQQANGIN